MGYTPLYLITFDTGLVAAEQTLDVSNTSRVTISNTVTHGSSDYALKVAASGTNDWGRHPGISGTRQTVYAYLATLPTSDLALFHTGQVSGSDHRTGIGIRTNGNWATFHRDGVGNITWGSDGDAASATTWYRLEIDHDQTGSGAGTTHNSYGWVDGTAQPTTTVVTTNSTGSLGHTLWGNPAVDTSTDTLTMYFDDAMGWSGSDAPSQPVGAYYGVRLDVTGAGTDNNASSFTDSNANNPPAATSYNLLDEIPAVALPSSDYVSQTTIGSGDYMEYTFEDLATTDYPLGVLAIWGHDNGGASSSVMGSRVEDPNDSTETSLHSSSLSDYHKYIVDTRASGGNAWVAADINALTFRVGYSTNVTPNPSVHFVCLEVALLTSVTQVWLID